MVKTFQNKLKKLSHGNFEWALRKRKQKEKKEWVMKKRILLKAVFLGKQSVYRIPLRSVNFDFELVQGLFLILECPTKRKVKKVKDVVRPCLY